MINSLDIKIQMFEIIKINLIIYFFYFFSVKWSGNAKLLKITIVVIAPNNMEREPLFLVMNKIDIINKIR